MKLLRLFLVVVFALSILSCQAVRTASAKIFKPKKEEAKSKEELVDISKEKEVKVSREEEKTIEELRKELKALEEELKRLEEEKSKYEKEKKMPPIEFTPPLEAHKYDEWLNSLSQDKVAFRKQIDTIVQILEKQLEALAVERKLIEKKLRVLELKREEFLRLLTEPEYPPRKEAPKEKQEKPVEQSQPVEQAPATEPTK